MNKYEELLEVLEVGKIYRYIGDGEFEIIDIEHEIDKSAREKAQEVLNKAIIGSQLPQGA